MAVSLGWIALKFGPFSGEGRHAPGVVLVKNFIPCLNRWASSGIVRLGNLHLQQRNIPAFPGGKAMKPIQTDLGVKACGCVGVCVYGSCAVISVDICETICPDICVGGRVAGWSPCRTVTAIISRRLLHSRRAQLPGLSTQLDWNLSLNASHGFRLTFGHLHFHKRSNPFKTGWQVAWNDHAMFLFPPTFYF